MDNELRRLTDEDLRSPVSIYIADLQAQVRTLTEERDRAKVALVCRVCGKNKPYAAICFDCLNEDVGEVARWHEEVGLSNSDGTEDICRRCHTSWPCDAIKALKLRDEANRQLAALIAAGVTDYSKLTDTNRVDCHFCNGVWRTEEPAKHKPKCPLDAIQGGNE